MGVTVNRAAQRDWLIHVEMVYIGSRLQTQENYSTVGIKRLVLGNKRRVQRRTKAVNAVVENLNFGAKFLMFIILIDICIMLFLIMLF